MKHQIIACPKCDTHLATLIYHTPGFDICLPCPTCGGGPRFICGRPVEPLEARLPLTAAQHVALLEQALYKLSDVRLALREGTFSNEDKEWFSDLCKLCDDVAATLEELDTRQGLPRFIQPDRA